MDKKKCVHKLNMKGHGKPWCVLFRREASCNSCFGVERIRGLYNKTNPWRHLANTINTISYREQVQAALRSQEELCKKLVGRPGVTLLHDEFLIDSKEWVSSYTEGELVTHNNQLARVIKITGPVVKIKLQRRGAANPLDVMEWDLKKWSPWRLVKKKVRRLWHKVCSIQKMFRMPSK